MKYFKIFGLELQSSILLPPNFPFLLDNILYDEKEVEKGSKSQVENGFLLGIRMSGDSAVVKVHDLPGETEANP